MKIQLMLIASGLLALSSLTSCTGSKEDQSAPPITQTLTTEFDNFSLTAPQYAFINEPFKISIHDSKGTTTQEHEVKHHSGFTPPKCCDTQVFHGGRFHSFHIPTYNSVLYVGPPITIKANRDHAIGLTLEEGFLHAQADTIKSISWQQTAGEVVFSESSDKKQVNFTTTNVNDIERWVFKATINTLQGRIFTQEKVVFVIPEASWVDALQVYDGNSDSIVALRSNQTLYASDRANEHRFLAAPADNIRHIASLSVSLIFAATDNALFEGSILTGEWHQVPQDLGRITYMIDAAEARSTVIIVNEAGDVYDTYYDYDLRAQSAVSVAPLLFQNIFLSNAGTVIDKENQAVLFDSIKQLHSKAFLTNDNKVGTLYAVPDLSIFDQYDDYIFVTSAKESTLIAPGLQYYIFALRPNGNVVSTSRLPPMLRNITAISSGTGTHAALSENGTVYRWGFKPRGDVLNGKTPNPINLTQAAFNEYLAKKTLN